MTSGPDTAANLGSRFHILPLDSKLAFIFPGQGSQQAGMGKEAAASSPVARQIFELANGILATNLSGLCFNGPADELTRTANAQPAILTTSIAIFMASMEHGAIANKPAFLAGHSLGEYTALVIAGALDFEDALKLVAERGRLMEEASKNDPGTMAAIVGLEDEEVERICGLSGAEPCNYNSPTQIVIGGTPAAVETACRLAKESGGRGLPLNVSGAFHTSLMKPAACEFSKVLSRFTACDPAIPVVGNVAATCLADADSVLKDLAEQIRAPVRWSQSLSVMIESGVRRMVEIGPGRTLTTALKRSYPQVTSACIDGTVAPLSPSNV